RFLQGAFRDRARSRRARDVGDLPRAEEGGVREVPQSRVPVRHRRRLRRADGAGRTGRGDGRGLARRLPREVDRAGARARVVAEGARVDRDRPLGPAIGPARERGIPCAPGGRARPPGGRFRLMAGSAPGSSLATGMGPGTVASIEEAEALLASADYVADRRLATAVFLALRLARPLFLEGEAGVGKTELAKALAAGLGAPLIRLQCYEGLDVSSAVYEWNVQRQMMAIRLAEASGRAKECALERDLFSAAYLVKRPILAALESAGANPPVLLIDELDRADEPFEAYLLEALSDFQVTIPERGTVRAARPPLVVVASTRTRESHEAVKRRCLYRWVDYPSGERELEILRRK